MITINSNFYIIFVTDRLRSTILQLHNLHRWKNLTLWGWIVYSFTLCCKSIRNLSRHPYIFKLLKSGQMKELITIRQSNDGKEVVSAKELYTALGYEKSQWSRWYKKSIVKNDFAIEFIDYQGFDIVSNGNKTKDFALSIDFAKKLSMLARTNEGEIVRDYFIEIEKQSLTVVPNQNLSPQLQVLQGMLNTMAKQETLILENKAKTNQNESRLTILEAKTTTRPDYFTIAGYGSLTGVSVNIKMASSLGRKASKICNDKGYETDKCPDPRFGTVKMYPKRVLEQVFKQAIN